MTSEPRSRLSVRVSDPSGRTLAHPLDGATRLTIGSAPECQIRLDSAKVHALHATLIIHPRGCVVRSESPGLLWIDDVRVTGRTQPLKVGATLRVGEYRIVVDETGESMASANAPGQDDRLIVYRRELREELLERLDLRRRALAKVDSAALRRQAEALLWDIMGRPPLRLPSELKPRAAEFSKEILDECLGLGPLEDLLNDPAVSEIMVLDANSIYVERDGEIRAYDLCFTSDEALNLVIQRIVRPLGRQINQAHPMVDARLKDGSRVNAVIPPLALRGPCLTIRRFPTKPLTADDLINGGSLTAQMAAFLQRAVRGRQNILISGGTGSGKTTLLNILSSFIGPDERIITVEDAAELRMYQKHVVRLETRPASLEGGGEYTIRDLVRNALRMRPDRIVVGECRGGEAFDMLQAMNTGHAGSLTTIHANSPTESLIRLENLVLLGDSGAPSEAIRDQVVRSIGLVVQQSRLRGGVRRITHISEVVGLDARGQFIVEDIFRYVPTGLDPQGRQTGRFQLCGHLPSFLGDLIATGLVEPGGRFI